MVPKNNGQTAARSGRRRCSVALPFWGTLIVESSPDRKDLQNNREESINWRFRSYFWSYDPSGISSTSQTPDRPVEYRISSQTSTATTTTVAVIPRIPILQVLPSRLSDHGREDNAEPRARARACLSPGLTTVRAVKCDGVASQSVNVR